MRVVAWQNVLALLLARVIELYLKLEICHLLVFLIQNLYRQRLLIFFAAEVDDLINVSVIF